MPSAQNDEDLFAIAASQRFAYVDTVMHNGTMLEIIETDDAMRKGFEYMQTAAASWDGSRPVRG